MTNRLKRRLKLINEGNDKAQRRYYALIKKKKNKRERLKRVEPIQLFT